MKTTRRDFLTAATTTAGTVILSQWLPGVKLYADPVSQADPDHFMILIRTYGAMDCTLGLDPQILPAGLDEKDMFLEYRPEDIVSAGRNMKLGPAALALKPFVGDIAVINGILMSTANNDHDALNLYMRSGNGRGQVATFPIELAAIEGSGPFGVIVDQSPFMGKRSVLVSTTTDVTNAAQGDSPDFTKDLSKLVTAENGASEQSGVLKSEKALIDSMPVVPAVTAVLKSFPQPQNASAANQPSMAVSSGQAVAAAFAGGAAKQAEINVTGGTNYSNLDTHSDHPKNHLQAQINYWNDVTDIFNIFKSTPYKESSLFDATTFFVVTEFSRTPYLNAARGKDHNPLTNSIILAGKGIAAGQTFGASRPYGRNQTRDGEAMHAALPLNFKTGEVAQSRADAAFIRPEHVIRSLASLFGDPKGLEVDYSLPVIPGLLKT